MSSRATVTAEKQPAKAIKRRPFFHAPALLKTARPGDKLGQPSDAVTPRLTSLPFPMKSISDFIANRKSSTSPSAPSPETKTTIPIANRDKPAVKKVSTDPDQRAGEGPKATIPPGGPIPKAPQKPTDDPAFVAVSKQAKRKALSQKKHDGTETKLHQGKLGAKAPAGEKIAHAKGGLVQEMNKVEVKPKLFDRDQFLRQFDEQIKAALPKSKGEMEKFGKIKEPNQPAEIKALKGQVTEGVKSAKNDATQPIAEASQKEPNPNTVHAPEFKPLEKDKPGAVPVVENTQQAAPKRKTDDEISMEKQASSLDSQMQESEVTPTQLETSNEPGFVAANETKNTAQEKARNAPEEYRKEETPALESQKAETEGSVSGQLKGIFKLRMGQFAGVDTNKDAVRSRNELMRELVRKRLEDIYTATKNSVDTQLAQLEKAVTEKFVNDLERATKAFKKNVDAKISDLGISDAISDFFSGTDSKQNIFNEEKAKFESELRTTINDIATTVEQGLNSAMRTIQKGRDDVAAEIAKMSPEEKKIADEIKGDIDGKFDVLESNVNDKQGALVESLAKKYVDGVAQLNEIFEKIKEENMGWLARAAAAIRRVIRTIGELKDMLFGVLAKAKSVIMSIIKSPIRFIGNLIEAIKMGLGQFTKNIWEHLKQGFFTWLLGSLPPGIEIPKNWDLLSIFRFVASILGLTWANIRDRAVKKIGEPVVKAMETTFDVFMVIIKEGISGVWRLIKEKLNNLKEMVIDAVLNFLKERVIMAGIAWIIGLMNPVGAFIKACKAIYDIIKFFIERGKQIMELVNSILDSIAEIVAGKLGSAAKRVEDSLARAIPIAIGFLAALLGLGGLSEKVMEIIKRIRAPINKAIDWILDKAIAFVKKIGIDKLLGKVKEGVDKGKAFVVEKGKQVADKVLNFFGVKSKFVDAKGASHSVYFQKSGNSAVVMVASDPKNIEAFLRFYESEYSIAKTSPKGVQIAAIRAFVKNNIMAKVTALAKASTEAKKTEIQQKLLKENVTLSEMLQTLLAGDRKVGKIIDSYRLEGLAGTYGSMPKPPGDELTADHQPQDAIFEEAAKMSFFGQVSKMAKRAAGRARDGYAINLYSKRHIAGRTFGGKSGGTLEEFRKLATSAIKGLATNQEKRDAVVEKAIKPALKLDVDAVHDLIEKDVNFADIDALEVEKTEKTELKRTIKKNIKSGEGQLKSQNLDELKN
jgi:hypothetical protein